MNLHRLNEYVMSTVVIMIGLLIAVACGKLTASGEQRLLAIIVAGCIAVTGVLVLRNRIWILIPMGWMLIGTCDTLPLPFRVVDFIVIYVTGAFMVLTAVRVVRTRAAFDSLDFWILALCLLLLFAFIRNPVGTHATGSEMVGGRPYFNAFIGFLAYLVLRRAPINSFYARQLPFYGLAAAAIVSMASATGTYFPNIGSHLAQYYSGFAPPDLTNSLMDDNSLHRGTGLSAIGSAGMLFLTSYCTPITLFIPVYPVRCLGAMLFSTANLLSGFRISVLGSFANILIVSWVRRRYKDILIISAVSFGIIGFLSLGIVPLPLSAQRALSFFPGAWKREAVDDAESSTQWRIDMWKMILSEDKWIKNKWLGDGFGFSTYDLSIMESMAEGGAGFAGGSVQEGFMIVGAYHSGPLSTIRYVGYVGLAVFFAFIVVSSVKVYRLINRTQGTKLFPVTLFIGLPILIKPLFFVFVFGAFDSDLPEAFFCAGMIRLLERAVEEYARDTRVEQNLAAPLTSPARVTAKSPRAALTNSARR